MLLKSSVNALAVKHSILQCETLIAVTVNSAPVHVLTSTGKSLRKTHPCTPFYTVLFAVLNLSDARNVSVPVKMGSTSAPANAKTKDRGLSLELLAFILLITEPLVTFILTLTANLLLGIIQQNATDADTTVLSLFFAFITKIVIALAETRITLKYYVLHATKKNILLLAMVSTII